MVVGWSVNGSKVVMFSCEPTMADISFMSSVEGSGYSMSRCSPSKRNWCLYRLADLM